VASPAARPMRRPAAAAVSGAGRRPRRRSNQRDGYESTADGDIGRTAGLRRWEKQPSRGSASACWRVELGGRVLSARGGLGLGARRVGARGWRAKGVRLAGAGVAEALVVASGLAGARRDPARLWTTEFASRRTKKDFYLGTIILTCHKKVGPHASAIHLNFLVSHTIPSTFCSVCNV
jgi:hypothetical protein